MFDYSPRYPEYYVLPPLKDAYKRSKAGIPDILKDYLDIVVFNKPGFVEFVLYDNKRGVVTEWDNGFFTRKGRTTVIKVPTHIVNKYGIDSVLKLFGFYYFANYLKLQEVYNYVERDDEFRGIMCSSHYDVWEIQENRKDSVVLLKTTVPVSTMPVWDASYYPGNIAEDELQDMLATPERDILMTLKRYVERGMEEIAGGEYTVNKTIRPFRIIYTIGPHKRALKTSVSLGFNRSLSRVIMNKQERNVKETADVVTMKLDIEYGGEECITYQTFKKRVKEAQEAVKAAFKDFEVKIVGAQCSTPEIAVGKLDYSTYGSETSASLYITYVCRDQYIGDYTLRNEVIKELSASNYVCRDQYIGDYTLLNEVIMELLASIRRSNQLKMRTTKSLRALSSL
jgi:hypothetical protein